MGCKEVEKLGDGNSDDEPNIAVDHFAAEDEHWESEENGDGKPSGASRCDLFDGEESQQDDEHAGKRPRKANPERIGFGKDVKDKG